MIYIFQSTLPQGKWLNAAFAVSPPAAFQSTLPQGKWQIFDFLSQIVKYISIHTSAREVTSHRFAIPSRVWFQSTLPQGKWHKQTGHPTQGLLFQSTLPQGKWRWRHWLKKILIYFNPHFRKGSDDYLISSEWLSKNISIHTSAREVTGSTPEMCKGSGISIHTSAREVTWSTGGDGACKEFQSTLPQGKWPLIVSPSPQECDFNPHFRKGSDST